MTLTLRLPEDVEARLRKQAAAAGQDAAQYAAAIVERALASGGGDAPTKSTRSAAANRISSQIEQFLQRVNSLGPTSKPPLLQGLEAEFEQHVIGQHRHQGGIDSDL